LTLRPAPPYHRNPRGRTLTVILFSTAHSMTAAEIMIKAMLVFHDARDANGRAIGIQVHA
jgi:hypothetical protein